MHEPYEAPGAVPAPSGYEETTRVLVVDDDPTVAEVVSGYLDRAGYVVDRVADGPAALARAAAHWPDLVVLDLMLPGMDGLEVCRRMRSRGPVPVIMLTARGDEDDRILGLEVGADDYVTKPFSPRELVLRVESVLRRTRPAAAARPLHLAGLALDPAARRASKNGEELALTIREFDLLAFFLRNPGRAYSREDLMREVWGWDFGDLSTVTVHVRRLRGKVEDDPARPRLIQTVWGVGYRFEQPPPGEGPVHREQGTLGSAPAHPGDAGLGEEPVLRRDTRLREQPVLRRDTTLGEQPVLRQDTTLGEEPAPRGEAMPAEGAAPRGEAMAAEGAAPRGEATRRGEAV